jgi:sugar phosphate isomerase/epimerase
MARLSYIIVERPDSFGSYEKFVDALRRLKDWGYQGVEFNLTQPAGFEVDTLCKLVESINLPVVSFLTGANYFSEGLCLSSPNPDIRQRAVERLKSFTRIAAQFGAVIVVGQMQGFLSDEPDQKVGEARIEACMRDVVEAAERYGTTIVFEPVNHLQAAFNNNLSAVAALTARIDSPRFKPMLDTFHINIEEQSMTEPILRAGKHLGHFHLCESNGGLLGSGHLDFKSIFAALDSIAYDGYISIKVYRQPWHIGAESSLKHLALLSLSL